MNTELNQSWYANLPLYQRLILTLLIVVLTPLMIAFVVIQREVRSIDEQNLQLYITERGTERHQLVEEFFNRARTEMDFLVNTYENRQRISYLFADMPVSWSRRELVEYMDDRMINSGLFSQVRILAGEGNNADLAPGMVLISSNVHTPEGPLPAVEVGSNQAQSPIMQAARIAVTRGDSQRMTAYTQNDDFIIEIVHVVYHLNQPQGYVVGRIDTEESLLPLLASDVNLLQHSTFLATAAGDIIALEQYESQARASATQVGINQVLGQDRTTTRYRVEDEPRIGYVAAVEDTPFILVTEAPAATTFTVTLQNAYNNAPFVIIGLLSLAGGLAFLLGRTLVPPLEDLMADMRALRDGSFTSPVTIAERRDELGEVGRTFIGMRDEIKTLMLDLQANISRRVRDVQATQEVARFAATQRDVQSLMDSVVDLIIELFPNIYHAQIFLLDQRREYAVLRASTGEPGRQLLRRGHRLAVGSVSVIGQVTEQGRVVIARDTAESDIHKRNEFLLDTLAELAIPLQFGDNIIGALDVQSRYSDSFDAEEVNILETMADQIALAIQNARLYQESMRRLEYLQQTRRETTGLAWKEHMDTIREKEMVEAVGAPATIDLSSLREQAITSNKPAIGDVTERDTVPFAVPIQLRGYVLGAVEWEIPQDQFTGEKIRLAQELVNRLAVSLDNARLFQEGRRATERERVVNEIAARLTTQTDIDEILQTAVREVGLAMRVPQVSINLSWDKKEPGTNGNGHHPTSVETSDGQPN